MIRVFYFMRLCSAKYQQINIPQSAAADMKGPELITIFPFQFSIAADYVPASHLFFSASFLICLLLSLWQMEWSGTDTRSILA